MKPAHKMINVDSVISLAVDGIANCHWYDSARKEIETVCHLENWQTSVFTAYLALLSPRVSVVRNIRFTLEYAANKVFLNDVVRNIRKAIKVYEKTGEIGGYKVPQFYRALSGDTESIVLDSWMAKALFSSDNGNDIKKFRRRLTMLTAENTIRLAAKELGIAPRDCQACIWEAIISRHGGTPARYSVLSEYSTWCEYGKHFPTSGSIDSGYVAGEF